MRAPVFLDLRDPTLYCISNNITEGEQIDAVMSIIVYTGRIFIIVGLVVGFVAGKMI